jgi:hypothetical protein
VSMAEDKPGLRTWTTGTGSWRAVYRGIVRGDTTLEELSGDAGLELSGGQGSDLRGQAKKLRTDLEKAIRYLEL